jgi:hypothetical protein
MTPSLSLTTTLPEASAAGWGLSARAFLEKSFMDYGMIGFEAGELIDKHTLRHFAQLVNTLGLLARKLGQRNLPTGMTGRLLDYPDIVRNHKGCNKAVLEG